MRPGRFLTACLLYFGALGTTQAILSYALEPGSGGAWGIVALLVGVGAAASGVDRLRKPDGEEQPDRYGPWLYALGLFLAGYTGWLAYTVWLSIAGSAP